MLKAVLDTNVIVSGTIVKRGVPYRLLTAWRGREWNLVTSPQILREVQRVLGLPKISGRYGLTGQDVTGLIGLFEHRATVVPGHLKIPRTARDPEDDHILACAKEGQADYIVSGDQDLLSLERYETIPIITPAAFAAILRTAR